jgi:hypothetical protein
VSDRLLRVLVYVWLLLIIVVVVALAFVASAQTPIQATDRTAVLEQLVRDVTEHRGWLEQQLAAAKAVNAALQQQLSIANARCPAPEPPKP